MLEWLWWNFCCKNEASKNVFCLQKWISKPRRKSKCCWITKRRASSVGLPVPTWLQKAQPEQNCSSVPIWLTWETVACMQTNQVVRIQRNSAKMHSDLAFPNTAAEQSLPKMCQKNMQVCQTVQNIVLSVVCCKRKGTTCHEFAPHTKATGMTLHSRLKECTNRRHQMSFLGHGKNKILQCTELLRNSLRSWITQSTPSCDSVDPRIPNNSWCQSL